MLAGRAGPAVRCWRPREIGTRIMTPEAIAAHQSQLRARRGTPRQLAGRFYQELFRGLAEPAAAVPGRPHLAAGAFRSRAGARHPQSRGDEGAAGRCAISARSTCTGERSPKTTHRSRGAVAAIGSLSRPGTPALERHWRAPSPRSSCRCSKAPRCRPRCRRQLTLELESDRERADAIPHRAKAR